MGSMIMGAGVTAYIALSIASRAGLLPRLPQYYIKLSHFGGCITIASIVGIILATLATFVPSIRTSRHSIPRMVGRVFLFLSRFALDIDFVVEGEENIPECGVPAVLVANHQSSLDLASMARIFPQQCTVMAKKSLGNVPFIGAYCMHKDILFDFYPILTLLLFHFQLKFFNDMGTHVFFFSWNILNL